MEQLFNFNTSIPTIQSGAFMAPLRKLFVVLTGLVAIFHSGLVSGQSTWMGMKFTTGNASVSVKALGRVFAPNNNQTHQLKLITANDGKDVPGSLVSLSMAGGKVGDFKYANLPAAVKLAPNTAYFLVSRETQGGDSWYGADSKVTTTAVATCQGGVYWDGSTWVTVGGQGNALVPVSFTYVPIGPENPSDPPSNNLAGLNYSYFEGTWSVLPNFAAMQPVKSGYVGNFSLAPRNRNDLFGFRFTGYIQISVAGTYTFYTTSDDGSKLYIGSTEVVNNDKEHGEREKSGTIKLSAGKHPITVTFFEKAGRELLLVNWSGPGIAKQLIPSSVLSRNSGSSNPPPTPTPNPTPVTLAGNYKIIARHSGKALDVYGYYNQNGAGVNQWDYNGGTNQIWQLTSTGDGYHKLVVKHSGKTLEVAGSSTADGAKVQQNANTGGTNQQWKIESLRNGYYKITARHSGKALEVDGGANHNAASVVQRDYSGAAHQQWKLELPAGASAARIAVEEHSLVELFPNPASDEVSLKFTAKNAGEGQLRITDGKGQAKIGKKLNLTPGSNTFTIDTRRLNSGVYFLKLQADGKETYEKLVITR